jgi:hypothetical protein
MTDAECERKIALLRASWDTFDDMAARISAELRKGPGGGGWPKDRIIRHVNGAEIAFIKQVREHHADAEPARSWRCSS